MAKVIEKIQLQLNITDLKIIKNQHVFTRPRSTVSALTSMTQNWYNATDNSHAVWEKGYLCHIHRLPKGFRLGKSQYSVKKNSFYECYQAIFAMNQTFSDWKNTTS